MPHSDDAIERLIRNQKKLEREVSRLKAIPRYPKSNPKATLPPNANDDITKGYSRLSLWIFGGITYMCRDATAGAAIWDQIN